jgi:hypothetical protein
VKISKKIKSFLRAGFLRLFGIKNAKCPICNETLVFVEIPSKINISRAILECPEFPINLIEGQHYYQKVGHIWDEVRFVHNKKMLYIRRHKFFIPSGDNTEMSIIDGHTYDTVRIFNSWISNREVLSYIRMFKKGMAFW